MHAHKVHVTVADNHEVRLRLPADFPRGDAEVIVLSVSRELPDLRVPEAMAAWIKATSGSIDDPTFVRHDQGEYEKRDELP